MNPVLFYLLSAVSLTVTSMVGLVIVNKTYSRQNMYPNIQTNDGKSYKIFTLPNQIHIMIVTSNKTEFSSLTLKLESGFMYDPPDFQGMSNYVQNLLTISSRYPQEDYLRKLLLNYSGYQQRILNEHESLYYFQIQNDGYYQLLDLSSRLFIDPLLQKQQMDRTLQVVHQKWKNGDQSQYFLRIIGKPNHPFNNFFHGNLQTLIETPSSLDKNPYLETLKFMRSKISANRMSLVIYTNDEMKKRVTELLFEYYGEIINKQLSKPSFKQYGMPLQLQRFHFYQSDKKQVKILFNTQHDNGSKAFQFIVTVLMRFFKENFCQKMITQKYAYFCNYTSREIPKEFNYLEITVDLVDENKILDILKCLFARIEYLKAHSNLEQLWNKIQEIQIIKQNHRDMDISDIIQISSKLASNFNKDILQSDILGKYDQQQINLILNDLNTLHMNVVYFDDFKGKAQKQFLQQSLKFHESDDKEKDISEVRSSDKTNDQSNEKSNDKQKDKLDYKLNEKKDDKSYEKSDEKSDDKSDDKEDDKDDKEDDKEDDKANNKNDDKDDDKEEKKDCLKPEERKKKTIKVYVGTIRKRVRKYIDIPEEEEQESTKDQKQQDKDQQEETNEEQAIDQNQSEESQKSDKSEKESYDYSEDSEYSSYDYDFYNSEFEDEKVEQIDQKDGQQEYDDELAHPSLKLSEFDDSDESGQAEIANRHRKMNKQGEEEEDQQDVQSQLNSEELVNEENEEYNLVSQKAEEQQDVQNQKQLASEEEDQKSSNKENEKQIEDKSNSEEDDQKDNSYKVELPEGEESQLKPEGYDDKSEEVPETETDKSEEEEVPIHNENDIDDVKLLNIPSFDKFIQNQQFGVYYYDTGFTDKLIQSLSNQKEELQLRTDILTPQNFEIFQVNITQGELSQRQKKKLLYKYPELLVTNTQGNLWHVHDVSNGVPTVEFRMIIRYLDYQNDDISIQLLQLLQLNFKIPPQYEMTTKVLVQFGIGFMEIQTQCFHDQLQQFSQQIVNEYLNSMKIVDQQQLDWLQQRAQQFQKRQLNRTPTMQIGINFLRKVLTQSQQFQQQKYELKLEQVQQKLKQLENSRWDILLYGNINQEQSKEVYNQIIEKNQQQKSKSFLQEEIIKLTKHPVTFRKDILQGQSIITLNLYQGSDRNLAQYSYMRLIERLMKIYVEDFLSNQLQLGFGVNVTVLNILNVDSLAIIVQSSTYDPEEIDFYIEESLGHFESFLSKMQDKEFQLIKSSIQKQIQQLPYTLEKQADLVWNPIRDGSYYFTLRECTVIALDKIQKQDALKFFQLHFKARNSKISLQLYKQGSYVPQEVLREQDTYANKVSDLIVSEQELLTLIKDNYKLKPKYITESPQYAC